MAIWLNWIEGKMPNFIAKIELQILMNLTSRVFEKKGKRIWMYKPTKALEVYGEYTRELLQNRNPQKDEDLRNRMWKEAFKTGSRLRKITGLSDYDQLQRLVFILYKNIGIEMKGNIPGDLFVSRCYFSKIYDSRMCQVISSIDNGIISGLYDGGNLQFLERITEGCAGCRACFRIDKDVSK